MNPTTSSSGVATLDKKNLGRIAQIIGPVLDVAFPLGKMPNIYNALVVKGRDTVGQPINVTCEVQQLLGNNRVRAVAMSATDGLTRATLDYSSKARRFLNSLLLSFIFIRMVMHLFHLIYLFLA
ncbi:hypothetical protein R6Q57_004825 [Mikania cordata]